jgi:NAD+ synthase (glutamine-hydrolysing)
MNNEVKISLYQLNNNVADITNNTKIILDKINESKKEGKDIIVFPELFLSGYPPNDLLYRDSYLKEINQSLDIIISKTINIAVIVGHPNFKNGKLYNCASVIHNQKIIHQHNKIALPNYSMFDEKRYFDSGNSIKTVVINNIKCCILICEDLWHEETHNEVEKINPEMVFCLNASPYTLDKVQLRKKIVKKAALKSKSNYAYLNLIGAQDSLVFDGGSLLTNSSGNIIGSAKQFSEDSLNFTYDIQKKNIYCNHNNKHVDENMQVYQALVLGIRDYVQKNNIRGITLGLSGGIDSALSLAICVDAIGPNRVNPILLPSKYTSEQSIHLAIDQAKLLGCNHSTIPINSIVKETMELTKTSENTLTEQNIQARSRALVLMTISNNNGTILVNTSNRSELATGYGTLYGDLCGGFCILKNIPKMLVYKISKWRNEQSPAILEEIINRPPTAELSHNQLDSDDLPPYQELDDIIHLYIDKQLSHNEIVKKGHDKEVVKKIINLINTSEFKRQQSAPGVQISNTSFGTARRMPITSEITI